MTGGRDLLAALLRERDAITLVANNLALSNGDLARVPRSARDVVVHFNRCPFLGRFLDGAHLNLVVLRQHFDTDRFHGWPLDEALTAAMGDAPERFHILFCLNRAEGAQGVPDTGAIPRSVLDAEDPAILRDYPLDPEISFSAPSTGFAVLKLLADLAPERFEPDAEEVRGLAQMNPWRGRPASPARRVLLCGFFDVRGGSFWAGHAWDAERRWIAARGLTDLAARPLWRRLLDELLRRRA